MITQKGFENKEEIRALPEPIQKYAVVPFERITPAELLLFKDGVVDGDEQAVFIPLERNREHLNILFQREYERVREFAKKLEGMR